MRLQPAPSAPADAERYYGAAAEWLARHGVQVIPAAWRNTPLVLATKDAALRIRADDGTGTLPVDHIAFATDNLEAAIDLLRTAGATELDRTTESVFFRGDGARGPGEAGSTPAAGSSTRSGSSRAGSRDERERRPIIEITRDTDKPDVLWCPMHPDVRSSVPGKCPICSMDLVPIPPPRVGNYRLEVRQTPSARAGVSALRFRIRTPDWGEIVEAFAEAHERLFHLFIISRDLRFFAHEHPVRAADGFELPVDLAPGAYMLIADFVPAAGQPQMVHHAIVTPGFAGSAFQAVPALTDDLADKTIDGMRVQLRVADAKTRGEKSLRFVFTDAADGKAVENLQPYLGVSGHLLVVSPDLTQAVHAHPELMTAGPEVAFGVVFPDAGIYKLWVQVQRGGRVATAPFVIRVEERDKAEEKRTVR
jgi:hypothetical protein